MDDATRRVSQLLAPLTNWERTRDDAPRFDLENMRALLASSDRRARPAPRVVQVGGSKGKGTTCAWLEAFARASGARTGVCASPHVSTIRERVRIDGRDVEGERLVTAVAGVLDDARGLDVRPSAFEVLTAAALDCFADAGVDLAVLEVGLGGRLDATTAVAVDASVLTGIELEHTRLLGDTITAIAAEKACILRPGKPAFVAVDGDAAAVVAAHAATIDAEIAWLGRDFGAAFEGTACRLWARDGAAYTVETERAPHWEAEALALGWACWRRLEPTLAAQLPNAIERPQLPGRFEVMVPADGHPLIFDGAHTERSAERLVRELDARYGTSPRRVLFGCARDKRWREILSQVARSADEVVVTELPGAASVGPETIRAWLAARGVRTRAVSGPAEGLERLREFAGPRVVTGSFFLVGAVRNRLLQPDIED